MTVQKIQLTNAVVRSINRLLAYSVTGKSVYPVEAYLIGWTVAAGILLPHGGGRGVTDEHLLALHQAGNKVYLVILLLNKTTNILTINTVSTKHSFRSISDTHSSILRFGS